MATGGFYPGEDQYFQQAESSAQPARRRDANVVRLMTIGDPGVGKTCFILQWADDAFNSVYIPTVGVDYKDRAVKHGKRDLLVEIWDTSGGDRFDAVTSQLYDRMEGIIVMFDVSNWKSFENVPKHIAKAKGNMPNIPMVLVGNKSDVEDSKRQVRRTKAQVLAKENNCHYFEITVKFGRAGIDEAVNSLVGSAVSHRRDLVRIKKSQKKEARMSRSRKSSTIGSLKGFPMSASRVPSQSRLSMGRARGKKESDTATISRFRSMSKSRRDNTQQKKKCVIL